MLNFSLWWSGVCGLPPVRWTTTETAKSQNVSPLPIPKDGRWKDDKNATGVDRRHYKNEIGMSRVLDPHDQDSCHKKTSGLWGTRDTRLIQSCPRSHRFFADK